MYAAARNQRLVGSARIGRGKAATCDELDAEEDGMDDCNSPEVMQAPSRAMRSTVKLAQRLAGAGRGAEPESSPLFGPTSGKRGAVCCHLQY